MDEKNSLRKSRTKEKGELFEAVFFDFFIQEPLKVINLWGYKVLILRKILNFATR